MTDVTAAPNLGPGSVAIKSAPAGVVPGPQDIAPGGPAEALTPDAVAAAAAAAAEAAKPPAPVPPVVVAPEPPKGGDPLEASQQGEVFAYDSTGDAVMDFALDFVGNLGFGPNDPAMVAAGEGNFDLLEIKLAAMGDKAKGYERIVALARTALDTATGKANDAASKDRAACAAVAGGDETLTAALSWATEQFKAGVMLPEEREGINAMFAAGGLQAVAATKMVMDAYSGAVGVVANPASTTTNPLGNGAPPGASQEPLTKRTLALETAAIVRKHGSNNYMNTPEYRALAARALSQR